MKNPWLIELYSYKVQKIHFSDFFILFYFCDYLTYIIITNDFCVYFF